MTTSTLNRQTATKQEQRVRYGRLWWVGLLIIAASIAGNLLVRAIALPFITVPPEFLPVSTAAPTIVFSAAGAIAAVLAYAIVGRFTRQPARIYLYIAIVALLLSFIPNIGLLTDPASAPFPGGNLGSVSVLMVQHAVSAVIAVWLLLTQATETVSTPLA